MHSCKEWNHCNLFSVYETFQIHQDFAYMVTRPKLIMLNVKMHSKVSQNFCLLAVFTLILVLCSNLIITWVFYYCICDQANKINHVNANYAKL